ncbi:hypothetical protein WDW86_03755 [Bdellovibrionota bacterium FG-2]
MKYWRWLIISLICCGMFSAVAQAAPRAKLTGEVQLGGESVRVRIELGYFAGSAQSTQLGDEKIRVGNDVFRITDQSNIGVEGRRYIEFEDAVLESKSVQIIRDPEMLLAIKNNPTKTAAEFHLANALEFRCLPEHNAIVLVSDDFRAPHLLRGNCLSLHEVKY